MANRNLDLYEPSEQAQPCNGNVDRRGTRRSHRHYTSIVPAGRTTAMTPQAKTLEGTSLRYYPLSSLDAADDVARLPMTIKILIEGLLRESATKRATDEQIGALAAWPKKPTRDTEIPFQPARILM